MTAPSERKSEPKPGPDRASWRLLQPRRFGGRGLPADEFITAVGALAARDASAGWLCAAFNAAAYQLAALPAPAAAEVWGTDQAAVVASAGGSRGRLARDDGGYLLTGRWPAVPGAGIADWLLLAAQPDGADGDDGADYLVLVPRSQAGLGDAAISEVSLRDAPIPAHHLFRAAPAPSAGVPVAVLAGAGAAAAVIGAADGLWHAHVSAIRERLATSYGQEDANRQAVSTREVARTASDIDAAMLQVGVSLTQDPQRAARAQRQAVCRAGDAADRLLAGDRRHALDASDPVTARWLDVRAGCRATTTLLDGYRAG